MASELELNHLDYKIYSSIKQIRGQKMVQISIELKLSTKSQSAKSF